MANEPVLIVDDNPSNLKLARIILSLASYTVQTATSAEEALVTLKTFKPELILMDIQLSDMDGLELTRKLRANPLYEDIAIIAITANAMKGDAEKALMAGCNGYISKPINTETLASVVAEYLKVKAERI